jgi:uncharacterized SAM-binding protein YcdF (DUF218 family)
VSVATVAVILACGVFVWVGLALFLEGSGRRNRVTGTWDAIVVPGARVLAGGRPSGALARRTECAVVLWNEGVAPRVVFTGGVGDNPPAEAEVAAAHAKRLGLPHEAIVLEDRSTTTEENAGFAAEVCPVARVVVATHSYHALRCRWVFQRYFDRVAVVGVSPVGGGGWRFALREVGVLAWYGVTGRLRLWPRGGS